MSPASITNRPRSKTLVTGAAGFLGTALVRSLLKHGHTDIRCLIRSGPPPALDTLQTEFPHARVEYLTGDLTSPRDAGRAVADRAVIYHLASAVRGSAADIFWNTVVGSKRLLEAMRTHRPKRVVLVSSFGVYGPAALSRRALIDESSPLEPHPERRDPYSHGKLRQELLFREYQQRDGFELVVLRPGVIYGPGGGHFSTRVGLNLPGLFLHFGGRNLLPLTYVENCADAIVAAGSHPAAAGQAYNVHDDDLPTARDYLRAYKRDVHPVRSIFVPYFAARVLSALVERYHRYSRGQLPAIMTPYKTASLWKGNCFSNRKLKDLGWAQPIPTRETLRRTFAYFKECDRVS